MAEKKKKKLSLTAKVIIIVTSFLLVLDAALGIILVNISSNSTKQVLNNKMIEMAQIAARLLDGDEIKNLKKEDKENLTPEYTHNLDILSKFQASHDDDAGDLAYIYCLVKNAEGKIVFSIDPDPETTSIFLEEEAIETDALLNAMNNGLAGVDPEPIVDRWGDLYTAYAPVFCGENGKEVGAVVGVDVWANWYNNQVKMSSIAIAATSIVSITAGVLIALSITVTVRRRFKIIANEMDNLEGELQNLLNEIKLPEEVKYEEEKNIDTASDDVSRLREQISAAQREIRRYIDYSKQRASIDSLTGINNRTAYFEKVKDINKKISEQEDYELVVCIYDINGLKDINDTYGHEYGDIAIIKSARTLEEIYGKDNIFRIGGDEIVVILENYDTKGLDVKIPLVEQLLKKINEDKKDLPAELSLSLGSALYNKNKDKEFLDVFRRADKTMYENKDQFYKRTNKRR